MPAVIFKAFLKVISRLTRGREGRKAGVRGIPPFARKEAKDGAPIFFVGG